MIIRNMSRPLRARGLKLQTLNNVLSMFDVAPPAGAWIETYDHPSAQVYGVVAPPAGAWIETYMKRKILKMITSRPLRARGLKLNTIVSSSSLISSRPLRARGLKLSRGH